MIHKYYRFIFVPSVIAFLLLLSDATEIGFILFGLFGLVSGIIFSFIKNTFERSTHLIIRIIGMIPAVLFCYALALEFSASCHQTHILESKISYFISDYSLVIQGFSYALAVIAFPFLSYTITRFITWIINSCKIISIRKLWDLLKGNNGSVLRYGKNILTMIINLIIAALMGTILLMGVYSLSIDNIDTNVGLSVTTLNREQVYPTLFPWCQSQLDNWTDSIMLLEAADDTKAPLLERIMLTYRHEISANNSPTESLIQHYMNGVEYDLQIPYSRYWHGFLVFLKPLLQIMTYDGIRVLNGIIQLTLMIITGVLMYKKNLKACIIPYVLSYLMLMPLALAMSMQFSACYYIFAVSIILLLLTKDTFRNQYGYLFFFNIGIATAYFDFLTYPTVTFGVPIAFYIFLRRNVSLEEKLSLILKNGISWCAGYAGMWFSKWILASIIIGKNEILSALDSVSVRSSNSYDGGTETFSLLSCELSNFTNFIKTPVTLAIIVFSGYIIIKYIKKSYLSTGEIQRILLPYEFIALIPIIWYAFAANHSMIHSWFTNKAVVITLISLLLGLINIKVRIDELHQSQ
nr:hypothetical protein [uncultured Anaerostipes sp.]